MIAATALATFAALFLTSRPYDPMNSTLAPQAEIPQSQIAFQPSPKASPTATQQPVTNLAAPAEAGGQTASTAALDDAQIQAEIERKLARDTTLSKLDVSAIVESGKVSLLGSVGSQELKVQVERAVRSVKGVIAVENQLIVTENTPGGTDFSL